MNFLKLLTIFFLVTVCGTALNAQVFGLRIGVNHARMQTDHNTISPFDHTTTSGVNLHGGVTLDIKINDLISIEPGLIFNKKNLRYKQGSQNSGSFFFQSEYALSYLNIPVPIKFNFKTDKSTIYGFAGGFLNLGTKGELTIQGESMTTQTLEEHDVWPKTKDERRLEKLDYGPTFGIGIVIHEFQVELYSNIGLVDTATGFDNVTSAKNRTFGISFSLRLGSNDSDFD